MTEETKIIGSKLSPQELEKLADKIIKNGHNLTLVGSTNNQRRDDMAPKKPIGGDAPTLNTEAGEFNAAEVKFMNLGNAAVRDGNQNFAEATSKVTITGDQLQRLIKIAQACIEKDHGLTINVYPNNRLSDKQAKYFNASAKINVEYLEEKEVITRKEVYSA